MGMSSVPSGPHLKRFLMNFNFFSKSDLRLISDPAIKNRTINFNVTFTVCDGCGLFFKLKKNSHIQLSCLKIREDAPFMMT